MSVHFSVLIAGFGVFLCCLCLHILLWRIRHPRNHAKALLAVFLIPAPVFLYLLSLLWPYFLTPDIFAIALLHIALSCAYIQVYPASQADSPSLKILVIVGESKSKGRTREEILARFDPEELFTARVRDLLAAGLVLLNEDKLILGPKGRTMVRPFVMLRNLVGLSAGKG